MKNRNSLTGEFIHIKSRQFIRGLQWHIIAELREIAMKQWRKKRNSEVTDCD